MFAPPYYQRCHEESDQDWYQNEWAKNGVWRISERSYWDRAAFKVVLVNCDEELVHKLVWPEAIQFSSYKDGTVDKFFVQAENKKKKLVRIMSTEAIMKANFMDYR